MRDGADQTITSIDFLHQTSFDGTAISPSIQKKMKVNFENLEKQQTTTQIFDSPSNQDSPDQFTEKMVAYEGQQFQLGNPLASGLQPTTIDDDDSN